MEGRSGNISSRKAPKLKLAYGSVSQLNLNSQNFIGGGLYHHKAKTPIFDPYASSDSGTNSLNVDSPLIQYLLWSSSGSGNGGGRESLVGRRGGGGSSSPLPLSSIENFETPPSRSPQVFKAPVKVEEDVLVMDGILVGSNRSNKSKGGGAGVRMRSPLPLSDSGGRSSPSPFPSPSPSGGAGNSIFKMEKCRFWEDSGTCRFGSKCQFAHGREELRPGCCLGKNKSEEPFCKPFGPGTCAYGTKSRFAHNQVKAALSPMGTSPAAKVLSTTDRTVSLIELEKAAYSGSRNTTTGFTSNDWSALDDGIEVTLPSALSGNPPSKEKVNAYMETVLYGTTSRKRLPVFTELCPE